LQGFDTVLSDMLQFTSGVNDVELSLELAGTALVRSVAPETA
jgi:23S rRNA (uridine2552-2'-O)-methyltransferase